MKKFRHWLVLSLAVILMITSMSPAFAQTNGISGSSVHAAAAQQSKAGHWAEASVDRWTGNGVINGYEDGTFQPDRSITRAEFMNVLNKVFGFTAQADTHFSDVPTDAWYRSALSVAKAAGYYEGFPNNEAKASAEITRQDAVTLLARVFSLKPANGSSVTFKDSAAISSYAREAVSALSGVISGYESGAFLPAGKITRAEAITLVDRLVSGYFSVSGEFAGGNITGNAIINTSGVLLKEAALSGNIYLTAGIGSGEATLDGVTVKGHTFVSGGGENSVNLNQSTLNEVMVDRKKGRVRLHLTGATRITKVTLNSDSLLELAEGTIMEQVVLNHKAEIKLASGAKINSLVINESAANTSITGAGDIGSLIVQASGVTLNGKLLAPGTTVVIGGAAAAAAPIATTAPVSGGSSGVTPTPVPTAAPTAAPTEEPGANIRVVTLADADATSATRSLFAYLQDIRGKHVLFGHQHATDEALSAPVGNVTSDTYSVVGDHPAMFGWDTLSLEGFEKPGLMTNTPEQNRDNLVAAMKQAYESGGVLALSSHMPNFVTGKDFYDTSGNVVSHILPGGDKHEEFNLFLDKIADFALHLKDDDGNFIPVIFRPFHEQNGGWFWWGAPYTTKEQYIEIYRYTEEYLRDVKGVHNFLYAFSPGSPFNSLEETFLKTYPGDDYVDILGFDTYYDGNNQGWFNTVVDDARLISKLADARGKVAAFTEFGYSNVKPTGTADKAFFTKLIAALQSDPDAKRMAYMLTWANFNYESIFVPYRGSVQHGDHELLPDFEQYYDDPYTYFSQNLTNVYNQEVIAAAKKPSMHIVSPTGQETIRTNTTTVRAKVLDQQPSKVVFVTAGSAEEHEMTLNDQGFYAAEWQPTADLNGKSTELTVRVYAADQSVQEETVKIYFGVPQIILKQFTFDQDIAGVQSHGAYPGTIGSDFSHISLEGDGKLAIGVSDLVYTDSWQELKAGLPRIAESVNLQWVNRVSFDVWVPLAAGAKDESANLRAAVELPPSSDKSVTADAAKLADLERISVNGAVYGKYSAVIDLSSSAQIEAATGLSFAIIGSGLQYDGPIYVDNIQLINAYTGDSNDPAWVDDFESYKSSDDLLRASYSPNGDTNTIELNTEHAQNGQYALKLDYTLAGQGYTGITKNLGSRDWSGTGKIKFWLVPDASGKKMVVQVKANDISFEYYPSLEDTIPRWVEIPFKDFTTAPWDSANTGKKLDAVNAKNVQAFSIYVNALSGDSYSKDHPFSSTLYIDQIQAVAGSPGDIPDGAGGGTTPPGETVEPGTLYGFESDTMGWNVEQNFAEATSLSLTSDAYTEGIQAVETGFNLALTSFEVAKYAEMNLSGLKTLSAELKLSSGAANVYLYVKTGSGWTWQDNGGTYLDSANGFTAVSLSLEQLASVSDIKAIGFKVVPVPGGSGTATLYLDNVRVSADE